MADFTKTSERVLLTHALSTNPATLVGTALDVSSLISGTLYMYWGSIEDGTDNDDPQRFIVQESANDAGNEDWVTVAEFYVGMLGTLDRENLTSASGAALTVASTTGFEISGDEVYVEDVNTVIDGEWGYILDFVNDTTITLYDALTNAKDTSDNVNVAETFSLKMPLDAVERIRVVFENEGAVAVDCHYKAFMTTADSFE